MPSSQKFAQLMRWIPRYGPFLSKLSLCGPDWHGAVLGALLSVNSFLLEVRLHPCRPYEVYQVAGFKYISDLTICTSVRISLQPLRALVHLESLHLRTNDNGRVHSSR